MISGKGRGVHVCAPFASIPAADLARESGLSVESIRAYRTGTRKPSQKALESLFSALAALDRGALGRAEFSLTLAVGGKVKKENDVTRLQALGRSGLVLLGAYFTLSSTLGIAGSIVQASEAAHAAGEAFEYEPRILLSIATPYLVGGLVPGLALLLGRRWLGRRMFPEPTVSEVGPNGEELIIIGAVLLGIYVAIGGVLGLVRGVSGIVMLPQQFSESFPAQEMKIGVPVALARIAIGLLLVRGSPRIARWL